MRTATNVYCAAIAAVSMLLAPLAAHAEDPGAGENSPDETLDELLAWPLTPEDSDRAYGSERNLLGIHGFVNFEYLDVSGKTSHFDLHHANLYFDVVLSERTTAVVEVEYEHSSETIHLEQAMAIHDIRGSGVRVAAGRFFAPFGSEVNDWYPTRNPLISRPEPMRQVVPGNWYEAGVRLDAGVADGPVGPQLSVALCNGLGDSANESIRGARQFRDGNENRAVIGRAAWGPVEGLALGVSGATMQYAEDRDDRLSFFGVDAALAWMGIDCRAEYVQSEVEDSSMGSAGDFTRAGYYFRVDSIVWSEDERALRVAGRVDGVDLDDRVAGSDDRRLYSLGLSWQEEIGVRLKGEVRFVERFELDQNDVDYLMQLVVDF